MYPVELQRTIAQPVSVRGFGYWSGEDIRVEFRPAPPNSGLTFVRSDVGSGARIPARTEFRVEIPRRTCLRRDQWQVDMVEHVLAALSGLQIDNCDIHVDRPEMPGCDGSALAFVEALDRAGVVNQGADAFVLEVAQSVRVQEGDAWIEARPSPLGKLSVEFQLDYPPGAAIPRQRAYVEMSRSSFRTEIAPCRTFLLASEAEQLVQQGLGQRVTARDLLVFGPDGPVENQLRFANECARHKILDVLGDLALTRARVVGEVVAYRSGHRLHVQLASQLAAQFGATARQELASLRATA